jgi:hypothetical protein
MATLRAALTIAVHHELSLKQADFTQAFLHANIDSDNLYMLPPQGLEEYITPGHVLKLNKSLYGLKQAPFLWHEKSTQNNPKPWI